MNDTLFQRIAQKLKEQRITVEKILWLDAVGNNFDSVQEDVQEIFENSEANKGPYKKYLSKRLGIGIKEPFSIRDRLKDLLEAIVRFESGAELPEHYKDLLEVAAL